MPISKILIADDEPLVRSFLQEALSRSNIEVISVADGLKALDLLSRDSFDLVITDMKMPKKSGLDVLKFVKANHPETLVIIITAFGSIENVVEAMNGGAFHYLIKPFSLEALEAIINKAQEHFSLVLENKFLRKSSQSGEIVAESTFMKNLLNDISKIATSTASVFISGESGTGKEVVAKLIHTHSMRANFPFIKVNCAAIPETLVESEFFGHEKGSFTGALTTREGRFELANKGTLLLDEITEIPLTLQPKLLRAIQEQEFERVGGTKAIKVDIRFIATSNRDMQSAIQDKIFREDLFYRLNVLPLHLSPLRERVEDILPLANYFLLKFCAENHKPIKEVSEGAKDKLLSYRWPGNVRELANIIERVVVLGKESIITADEIHLTAASPIPPPTTFIPTTLFEMEKKLILETLLLHNNNKTKAAQLLGIAPRTLRNKLKIYERIRCNKTLY